MRKMCLNLNKRMELRKNEEAVSPVIGTILMVAITVILAAVIAAFVFGMGSNVQATHNAAYKVSRNYDNSNNATLTLVALDSDITIRDGAVRNATDLNNPQPLLAKTVGAAQILSNLPSNTTKVIVNVTFSDNSQKVVLDTQI